MDQGSELDSLGMLSLQVALQGLVLGVLCGRLLIHAGSQGG